MERWRGKVAVVTGASAGIGAAISERLVEEGIQVVGFARRVDKVQKLSDKLKNHKGQLHAVQVDITKEEDVLKGFKWVLDNLGPVHILINNAGLSINDSMVDGNTENWRKVFDTNVLGLCIATREAFKIMKSNTIDGHIIHINSLAGHRVSKLPGMNIYSASKYAVTALTETLRQELNYLKSKIKVTSVSPGAVTTEFLDVSGLGAANANSDLIKNIPFLQAEDLADAVLYVLATPPHVQVHELMLRHVGGG